MEAFLDGTTPLEIFRRLIVGSEGTLTFIPEAVFETMPDDQYRLTSFMIFPDMYAACAAVEPFVDHGASAVELMDRASLRAVEGKPGVPDRWKTYPRKQTRCSSSTARPMRSHMPRRRASRMRRWPGLRCSSPRSLHATRSSQRSSGMCAAACLRQSAAPGPRAHRSFWRTSSRRSSSPMARLICRHCSPSTATLESSSDTPPLATCTPHRTFPQRSEGGRSLWRVHA